MFTEIKQYFTYLLLSLLFVPYVLLSHPFKPFVPTITPVRGQPFSTGLEPFGVAYSPNGKWLAVGNTTDSTLSSFAVHQNGSLTQTPGSPVFVAGSVYNSVQYSPDSRFLAAASEITDGQVAIFSINQITGEPTLLMSIASGNNPPIALYSPNGKFLVAANSAPDNTLVTFAVNQDSGVITFSSSHAITLPGFILDGTVSEQIAFSPNGNFVAVANSNTSHGGVVICAVNQTTGALTGQQNFDIASSNGTLSVAYSPNGKFLAAANLGNSVYIFSVNPSTGALTPVAKASTPNTVNFQTVGFSPDNRFVVLTSSAGNMYVFSIDPEGALTSVAGPLATGTEPESTTVFSPVNANGFSFCSTVNSVSSNLTSYAFELYDTENTSGRFSSSLFKAIRNKYFFKQ